jgi:hypothetical protein
MHLPDFIMFESCKRKLELSIYSGALRRTLAGCEVRTVGVEAEAGGAFSAMRPQ